VTDAELLSLWEQSSQAGPTERRRRLLQAACPEEPSARLAALSVGECDRRLLAFQRRSFGDQLPCVARCPSCGERLEFTLDAERLAAPGLGPPAGTTAVVESPGLRATVRLPTVGEVDAAAHGGGVQSLIAGCVVSLEREDAESELPLEVLERIDAALAALDPGGCPDLDLSCPACGHRWAEPFDLGSYIWKELASYAERLLTEVHLLAEPTAGLRRQSST
jgi:hypothetical protein